MSLKTETIPTVFPSSFSITAVLAYNIFGRNIGRIEADLEGFAYDLRELLAAAGPDSQPAKRGQEEPGTSSGMP